MSSADYAASLIPTTRSWSETVFRTALASRPEAEIQALLDAFYDNYEQQVAADPSGHAMDYIHILMAIEKQAWAHLISSDGPNNTHKKATSLKIAVTQR